MPGTALNQDGNKIILGPGRLWADVAIPAAGARITLHTDGTPESVANPNAKNLGLTESGAEVSFGMEVQDFESDESNAPHQTRILREPASIKATLLQVADLDTVMKYVAPNGTYATAAGYKEIAFGGLNSPVYYSFALIAPLVEDATKFVVVQLYKALNVSGVSFSITKKDQSKVPVELRGYSITTRAAGDQLGKLWRQIA